MCGKKGQERDFERVYPKRQTQQQWRGMSYSQERLSPKTPKQTVTEPTRRPSLWTRRSLRELGNHFAIPTFPQPPKQTFGHISDVSTTPGTVTFLNGLAGACVLSRRRRMPPNTSNPAPTSNIELGAGMGSNEPVVTALAREGRALLLTPPMTTNRTENTTQRNTFRILPSFGRKEWVWEELFSSTSMGSPMWCSRDKLIRSG